MNLLGFSCISILFLAGNLPLPTVLTQQGEAEAVKRVLEFGEVFSDAPESQG